jgi:DNA primase
MISEDKILEVQRTANIVDVVASYIPLKRAGSSFKALCPFHKEKTASFNVHPAKQIFHCFGCHKGGNVFSFVMAMEKIEFPEAVRRVAARYGITIVEERRETQKVEEGFRTQVFCLNRWAADFYVDYLASSPAAAAARAVLAKRALSKEILTRFAIGFSPDSWDTLLSEAKRHGFEEHLLEKAGLVLPGREGRGFYDRFRGRIMFPIVDVRDEVIGFGARILEGEGPKYINSPETVVFSKGRHFYGLNFARHKASDEGKLAIVEGYTDVMMAHQHGFEHVVATLGTALTPDHVSLARRFARTILLVYDGDSAGAKACERSVDILLEEDFDVRVAEMPPGLDPCDSLIRFGPKPFAHALESAREIFAYRMEVARKRHDLNSLDGKARFIDDMLVSIAPVGNAIKRDLQLRQLAELLKVGSSDLAMHAEESLRSRLRELARTTQRAATSQSGGDEIRRAPAPKTPAERASRELIEVMLCKPALIPEVMKELAESDFHGAEMQALARDIAACHAKTGTIRIGELVALVQDERLSALIIEMSSEEVGAKGNFEKRMKDCIAFLKRRKYLATAALQKDLVKKARGAGDTAAEDDALRKFQNIHAVVQSGKKK